MFDPVIDFIRAAFSRIAAFFIGLVSAAIALPSRAWEWLRRIVSVGPATDASGRPRRFRHLRWGLRVLALVVVLVYMVPLLWHTAYIRGFDLSYAQDVVVVLETPTAPGERVPGGEPGVCQPSQIVATMAELIDFSVNKNAWIPSMPQYKLGLFGLPWKETPFLDNKAAFQHGVLKGLRRTAVELSDRLGRVRGTSAEDPDLAGARGSLQFDDATWWFNPFDNRPFGPTTPTPRYYRSAISQYQSYNARLSACNATFDARPDNLRQFFDRIAADLGSASEVLRARSLAYTWDTSIRDWVPSTGNDRGWFDMRADDLHWEAVGQAYAYHGLLQAAREDFVRVVSTRELRDVWDNMEKRFAEAAGNDPWIVSNGADDGLFMPAHLLVMEGTLMRARANLTEMRDILDK